MIFWDDPEGPYDEGIFCATMAAAQGKSWPKKADGSEPCFITQKRYLHRISSLLGIAPHLGTKERERIIEALGIAGLTAHKAHSSLLRDTGYRNLGRVTKYVLSELASQPRPYLRLLESGYVIGLWGKPSTKCRSQFIVQSGKRGPPRDRAGPEIVTDPFRVSLFGADQHFGSPWKPMDGVAEGNGKEKVSD
jgi:hypothetical protein